MSSQIRINLDEKSPEELKRLLDSVKTNPTMAFKEKQYWVNEINAHLNGKTLDIKKARAFLFCREK